jgi:hypothetical protein
MTFGVVTEAERRQADRECLLWLLPFRRIFLAEIEGEAEAE